MSFEEVVIKDANSHETADVNSGGLDVNLQDQTTRAGNFYLSQHLAGPFTLYNDAAQGDYDIHIATGHGILASEYVFVYNIISVVFAKVLNVVNAGAYDVITLDTPLGYDFPATSSEVHKVNIDMSVDGSTNPVSFKFPPIIPDLPVLFELDTTGISVLLTGAGAMDYSTFGDQAALSRGMLLRHFREADADRELPEGYSTLFNFKTNGDFALITRDEDITDKIGGGAFGYRAFLTLAGQSNQGVSWRITPDHFVESLIQDDLTGLSAAYCVIKTHVVLP